MHAQIQEFFFPHSLQNCSHNFASIKNKLPKPFIFHQKVNSYAVPVAIGNSIESEIGDVGAHCRGQQQSGEATGHVAIDEGSQIA